MGQPTPLVRHSGCLQPLTGRKLAVGEVSGEAKGTNGFPDARRIEPYPSRCLSSIGDSSLSSMADTAALLDVVWPASTGSAQAERGKRFVRARRS